MERRETIHNYVVDRLGAAGRCDPDLVEELETHLADLVAQNMAKGMEEQTALAASVAELGDLRAVRRHFLWKTMRARMFSARGLTAFAALLCFGASSALPIVCGAAGVVGFVVWIFEVWPLAAGIYASLAATLLHMVWPVKAVRIIGTVLASGVWFFASLVLRDDYIVQPTRFAIIVGATLCLLSLWLPQRSVSVKNSGARAA